MNRDSMWEVELIKSENTEVDIFFPFFSIATFLALSQSSSLVGDQDIKRERGERNL